MLSRCFFEMVQKTAAAGIALTTAISAQTSLCVGFAETVGGVACVCYGRCTIHPAPLRVATPA
nr:formate dehydrogenase accessory sulfurtransferase FdhD [Azospirillum sp. TSH100]